MKTKGMPPMNWGRIGKRSKRGVSPIIATILLVAITVVLAAVLYVLVSGYLSHSTGTSIAIGWGSVSSNVNNAKTIYYYNTTVQSVSPTSLHWNDIATVTVKSSTGGPYSGTVALIEVFSASGGTATYSAGSWQFANGDTSSTPVSSGDTLVVELSTSNSGGNVVLAPNSSYTSTSTVALP